MTGKQAADLEVSDLKVSYSGDISILRGVDCHARAGQITGIIGPNGAGKSTLLKGVAGLAPVTGGRLHVDGRRIEGTPAQRLSDFGIAFVPQEHTIFPEMSVRENLRMGGWTRRRQRGWLRQRIDFCCNLFPELAERLHMMAGDLSGGQQRLLEIARGLMCEPSVLLLDEPTVGLSPRLATEVYEQIAALPAGSGVTVLLVDQNVRECLRIADYVYVLAMGRNDTEGTAQDISDRLPQIVQGWMQRKGSGLDVPTAEEQA